MRDLVNSARGKVPGMEVTTATGEKYFGAMRLEEGGCRQGDGTQVEGG